MKHFKLKNIIKTTKLYVVFLIVSLLLFSSIALNLSLNTLAEMETTITKSEQVDIEENTDTMCDIEVYNIETLTKAMFGDVMVQSSEYLYNLDGSSDYIYVEFENNNGYAIYYKDTMELLEYSAQGSLNYPNTNTLKYYGGPSMYLTKQDNCFVNVFNGESLEISSESAQEYSNEVRGALTYSYLQNDVQDIDFDYSSISINTISYLETNSNNEDLNLLDTGNTPPSYDDQTPIRVTNGTYISNYQYFLSEPLHGQNSTGTCGAVAA